MLNDIDELEKLPFTDLWIEIQPEPNSSRTAAQPRYAPERTDRSSGARIERVPAQLTARTTELRFAIENQKDRRGTAIGETSHRPRWFDGVLTFDGMRLRYAVSKVTTGALWAVIRRIPLEIPPLEALGLHPKVQATLAGLSSGEAKTGLVLMTGATGVGKTTTMVSTISHHLRSTGSTAYLVEDPCEYMLQGDHGNGFCMQTEVDDHGGGIAGINTALRSRPHMIGIGEIRESDVAKHAIRAATSGHIVMSTLHGGGVRDSLDAMVRLCEGSDSKDIREQLAQNLMLIVHQEMVAGRICNSVCDLRELSKRKFVRELLASNKTGAIEENSWTVRFEGPHQSEIDGAEGA